MTLGLKHLDRRRILALGFGLLASWIVATSVAQSRERADSLGATEGVVVSRVALSPGEVITEADVAERSHPTDLLPEGGPVILDQVVGSMVRSPILAGEVIAGERLVDPITDLEKWERAITIPWPLAPPPLDVGDVVELLGVSVLDVGGTTLTPSASVLAVCRVLVVGPEQEAGVTLACGQAEAVAVLAHLAVGPVDILRTPQTAPLRNS